jgi:hypothetical protein
MEFKKLFLPAAALVAGSVLFGNVANAAACAVGDVTFSSTYPADQLPANDCSNALDGVGNTPNLAALEAEWGAGFVEGVTLGSAGDGSASGAANVLGGFQFSISGIAGATGGTYALTITDTNGASAPNLPFYLDFVLYLKGGNADTAAYFFDDTLVDALQGDDDDDDTDLPEPGSLALLGLGLLGLGLSRRRKA